MATNIERLLPELRLQYVERSKIRRNRKGDLITPKIISPRSIALRYVRVAQKQQHAINEMILGEINTLLKALYHLRQDNAYEDATESSFDRLAEAIGDYIGSGLFEQSVVAVGFDVLFFSEKKYDRGIYKAIGFNGISSFETADLMQSWVRENLKLIKGANAAQLSSLETMLLRAARDGTTVGAITEAVQKILNTTVSRSTLIASDQAYKLDGQLDMLKQQSVGITHYFWRTVGDDRVRPSHQALEGRRRSWKNDAPHPGQEINCRCSAEPDINSVFADRDLG
jgi:SPP1 gp7 family putative phage head morphogenesis protein